MANTNVTIRIDDELKAEADELFADLGLSLSGAISVFLRQCVREGGLPFVPTTNPIASRKTSIEYAVVDFPAE